MRVESRHRIGIRADEEIRRIRRAGRGAGGWSPDQPPLPLEGARQEFKRRALIPPCHGAGGMPVGD